MDTVFPLRDRLVFSVLVNVLREKGCQKIAVSSERWDSLHYDPEFFLGENVLFQIVSHPEGMPCSCGSYEKKAQEIFTPQSALEAGVDGVIILDKAGFANSMRQLEPLLRNNAIVLPMDPSWLLSSEELYNLSVPEAVKRSPEAEYLDVSNLRGHFLEFGTFWGRLFFDHYFHLRKILSGKFWAFDSFAGLSTPTAEEIEYTGGDFNTGHYCCNRQSYETYLDLLSLDRSRVEVVEGFYENTLVGHSGSDYGIEPESVAMCVIDCDLKEPSRQVLEFILPLLAPGALLYFDDWRLTRGSPSIGQRSAALEWMAAHPEVELVELHRTTWRHQAFIFHRRQQGFTGIKQSLSI